MGDRYLTYFVSDVHLGLEVKNPHLRERRFVEFLQSIPAETTHSLYLLGDIWDFWYEYNDVVPMGYIRVFGAIMDLIDSGVKVYFIRGNHDVWSYRYFENLGMKILPQPYCITIGKRNFCLAHGDGLGPGMTGYKIMKWFFNSKVFQFLFSCIHPSITFRLAKGWSRKSRLGRNDTYRFKDENEPLYKWAKEFSKTKKVDYFIFGHYHTEVDLQMESGARMLIMKDWVDCSYYLCYNFQKDDFRKVKE